MVKYILSEHQLRLLAEMADDQEIETPMGGDQSDELLRFSGVRSGNSKIAHPSFSLPAGHTCKFAKDCKSCADRDTGKLTDNPELRFRCFSATQENYLSSLRKMRWHNYDLLRRTNSVEEMADLIDRSFKISFPKAIPVLRLHVGGDFYDQAYFAAWMEMARRYPDMIIYAYTKALPFWVKHKDVMPPNFRLTASMGGTHDNLIDTEKLKSSRVVFSQEEADALGLRVDHDDSNAAFGDESFATMLHGTQPPDSDAGKARSALQKGGFSGYGDKGKKKVKEGKVYLVSEYHAALLRNLLTEEIKRLLPVEREKLKVGGYDASLQVDQDGYEFILDLLSDKAKQAFSAISGGDWVVTNRDATKERVFDKIRLAGLNVHKVRKSMPTDVQGNVKRYKPISEPAGGINLKTRLSNLRVRNANDWWDTASADVKIDQRNYSDGTATYMIEPLSATWKKLLGGRVHTVNQDKIDKYVNILKQHNAKVLTEEVEMG